MSRELTDAWVLEQGKIHRVPGELILKKIELPTLSIKTILVEPIYGCWEGNMHHAIMRDPVDICLQRKEKEIVLGNAGVVRILKTGSPQSHLKQGDYALVFCNAVADEYGFPKKILGYDAKGTMGILAKRTVLPSNTLIRIPSRSNFSLKQWAAFSLRYITAWSNWKISYKCWRSQMTDVSLSEMTVASWGGGVGFAELLLAKEKGFKTLMITSKEKRFTNLADLGINSLDRNEFADLNFNPDKYERDSNYRECYIKSEKIFLNNINAATNNRQVAIFIDNIGLPVYRATLKALSRQGVITTSGWKEGMKLSYFRAIESIQRHQHIHTHYARYSDAIEAMEYAISNDWMPVIDTNHVYEWDEILTLNQDYKKGTIDSYFPIYKVNNL
ncbi:hypothetical protein [Polaribacter sp.]|uniref:hypothetical protein n=1 Tax=Polaribacter sp. TaxID=1920175 RepID=UPI003EF82C2C